MKEKTEIKIGKYKLIPITRKTVLDDIKTKIPENILTDGDIEWVTGQLVSFDAVFAVCEESKKLLHGYAMYKSCNQDNSALEVVLADMDKLSAGDICDVIYYSAKWMLKFASITKVLVEIDSIQKSVINRLKLLEFKKSEKEGYLELTAQAIDDGISVILSVLNAL